MQPPARSPIFTVAAGGGGLMQVEPSKLWPSRRGLKNGRLVCESMELTFTYVFTTDGSTSLAAPDLATVLKEIRITDNKGRHRRKLSGFFVRMKAFRDLGIKAPADASAVAISQTGVSRTIKLWIQFEQRETALRGADYCLEVDHMLDGGRIELELATAAELTYSAGTLCTIVSGTVQLVANMREEFDLEHHTIDEVYTVGSQATDEYKNLRVSRGRVREMIVAKPATGGGASMAGLTVVSIPAIGMAQIPTSSLKTRYLTEYAVRTADDPFYNDKAVPILWSKPRGKQTAHIVSEDDLVTEVTSTVTTPTVLMHVTRARSKAQADEVCARWNVPGIDEATKSGLLQQKTAGKSSRRNTRSYGSAAGHIPVKQPLPRAA